MKSFLLNAKYYWHVCRHRHIDFMLRECQCIASRKHLQARAQYHEQCALDAMVRSLPSTRY
ncbi:hypothetical protein EJF36_18640 [Bacillus sp. HMF5848]|uniref:hypothetical protein n=1 Tax=Bacillus sp. HMF5848 TaxID=2495421 RepID=UPI000F7AE011|nr:hypothetical protein [Bacillus sp. HMF5848]RSK28725.1 hypothetical protein EJF36_18640 [Bacillus sp. HMF5848]